ncbi:MAG: hypothetical protein K9K35_10440 [Rhodoferax sp.]|nr:hypothetical protein [Rhodoferax sp.]
MNTATPTRTRPYQPQRDGLAEAMIGFFRNNPGEELSLEDIVTKFGSVRGNIHTLLRKAIEAGLLVRARTDEGEYIYRGGSFYDDVPHEEPQPEPVIVTVATAAVAPAPKAPASNVRPIEKGKEERVIVDLRNSPTAPETKAEPITAEVLVKLVQGDCLSRKALLDVANAANMQVFSIACNHQLRGYGFEVAQRIKTLSDADLHTISVTASMEIWLRTNAAAEKTSDGGAP